MPKFIDLTGNKFDRWTVLKRAGTNKFRRPTWLCECDCGIKKEVDGQALRSGDSKSCGCLNIEIHREACIKRNTRHGMASRNNRTSEYKIWMDMRNRCNNPNNTKFHKYGAKGIKVVPRWDKYENFFEDMGFRPSDKHSIDRIDPYGPYAEWNCRWALMKVQQNNRSNNRMLSYKGEHKTLQQWADLTNIPRKTISNRIARGWEVGRALGFTD